MRPACRSSILFGAFALAALLGAAPALANALDASVVDPDQPASSASDAKPDKGKPRGAPDLAMDAGHLYAALVHIEATAVDDARSNATLGREREGTGTVIGEDGLILTIGYLVTEADDIKVTDSGGRTYPARVQAYDNATGLALLKTTIPMKVTPVPLGDSSKLAFKEPVLIAGWGGVPDTAMAYVVSRRPFAGNWEYLLDEAIFTTPPTTGWSGAALVDRRGTIVGVGSLLVREATAQDPKVPGNMFVPIDALKPILEDMIKTGHRKEPPRPWLGVAADEVQGRLIVSRVSPDGPAERAGVREGDIILGVGSELVSSQADFYRRVWSRGDAGVEVPLRVLQGTDVRELQVHSIDRTEYLRSATMY